MVEIFDNDKEYVMYNEQKQKTKEAIGKKVIIKYNSKGKDKKFEGTIKDVRGDDLILAQRFQELTLRQPNIISISISE